MTTHEPEQQETAVPLRPGDYVVLGEGTDAHCDEKGRVKGYADSILFEGEVDVHNPTTGKLRFIEDTRTEDIGRAEFRKYLKECSRLEIIKR